jgi:hypothetical protein
MRDLLDRDLFYKVQARIKSKKERNIVLLELITSLLKAILNVVHVQVNYLGNYSTGRDKKKYPYYRCDSSKIYVILNLKISEEMLFMMNLLSF